MKNIFFTFDELDVKENDIDAFASVIKYYTIGKESIRNQAELN